MDTELLRTFVEVNKTGHYAKAAENLFVTQSAVSARIIQLEKVLGSRLFDRRREGLRLNAQGARFLPFAENVLSTLARARQEMSISAESETGLRLGSTSGIWRYVLCPLISHDNGLNASSCVSESVDELVAQVDAGLLDVAVTFDTAVAGNLVADKLGSVTLALLSSSEGLSIKSAEDLHYTAINWGPEFADFHSQKLASKLKASVFTNLAEVGESIVKSQRQGCAYLPASLVANGLFPVQRAAKFSRHIYALYRSDNQNLDGIKTLNQQVISSLL